MKAFNIALAFGIALVAIPARAQTLTFAETPAGELPRELEAALTELPEEQRVAFVANEIEGISFKDLAQRTGVNINTLLTRKRLAVMYLRERLQDIYQEYARLAPEQKSENPAKKPLSQEFKEWVRAVVRTGTPAKGADA